MWLKLISERVSCLLCTVISPSTSTNLLDWLMPICLLFVNITNGYYDTDGVLRSSWVSAWLVPPETLLYCTGQKRRCLAEQCKWGMYTTFSLTPCNMLYTVNCLFGLFVFWCPQRKQDYMHLIKERIGLYLAFFPTKQQTIETVAGDTLWPRSPNTRIQFLYFRQPYSITVHTLVHFQNVLVNPTNWQCERVGLVIRWAALTVHQPSDRSNSLLTEV